MEKDIKHNQKKGEQKDKSHGTSTATENIADTGDRELLGDDDTADLDEDDKDKPIDEM